MPVDREPFRASASLSIPAASSGTVTVPKPADSAHHNVFIKSITVTPGASTTVTSMSFDGRDLGTTASIANTEDVFGDELRLDADVSVVFNNAGAGAATSSVEIVGYRTG